MKHKPGQYSIEYQSIKEWGFLLSNGRDRDDIEPYEYSRIIDAGDDYDKAVGQAKSYLPDAMGTVDILRLNNIYWNRVTYEWDFGSMDRIIQVHPNGTVEETGL